MTLSSIDCWNLGWKCDAANEEVIRRSARQPFGATSLKWRKLKCGKARSDFYSGKEILIACYYYLGVHSEDVGATIKTYGPVMTILSASLMILIFDLLLAPLSHTFFLLNLKCLEAKLLHFYQKKQFQQCQNYGYCICRAQLHRFWIRSNVSKQHMRLRY